MSSPGCPASFWDPGAVTMAAPGGRWQLVQSTPPCHSLPGHQRPEISPLALNTSSQARGPSTLQKEPSAQRQTQGCHSHTTWTTGLPCSFWAPFPTHSMGSYTSEDHTQGKSKPRLLPTNDQTDSHSPGRDTAGQASAPLRAPARLARSCV